MLNRYEDNGRSFVGALSGDSDRELIKAAFWYDPYTAAENAFDWNNAAFCAEVLWAAPIDAREEAVLERIPDDVREASQKAAEERDARAPEVEDAGNAPAYDEWFALAERNGAYLQFVPETFKTPELCRAAVRSNGEGLGAVPAALKTEPLCLAAVKSAPSALQYAPPSLKTPALYLAAVEADGAAIHNVPQARRSPELCLAAVRQNGALLRYAPEASKTLEVCLAAVAQNPAAIARVPSDIKAEVEARLGM
jgi:hypothetical protein